MVVIIQNDNPILRKVSSEIPISNIKNPEIQKIIFEMNSALNSQYDGIAIAAPQIGFSFRIFIISGKVFDESFIRGEIHPKDNNLKKIYPPNLIFINPIIKKTSKDKKLMVEGCLSIRPIYGKVRRATRVTVEAYDKNGKKFIKRGSGLIAHIFQHEIDHLNGILFTDKAKDIHEAPLEENKKSK